MSSLTLFDCQDLDGDGLQHLVSMLPALADLDMTHDPAAEAELWPMMPLQTLVDTSQARHLKAVSLDGLTDITADKIEA